MMRRFLGLAFLALCAANLAAPPAGALNRGGFKVTREHPFYEKAYPALGPQQNNGTGMTNWFTCGNTSTHCDLHRLDVDPQGLRQFVVQITLSWPNPRSAANAQGNDLNLGVWEPDPVDPICCRANYAGGPNTHPEQLKVGVDNPDPATYHLIVSNNFNLNAGYTLRADIITLRLPDLGRKSTPLPARPAATATIRQSEDDFEDFEDVNLSSIAQPTSPPRTVRVPGPDGEIVEVELPILAAGNRREAPAQGVNPVLPVVAALVVVGGATGGLLLWRRRRVPTA